MDRNPHSVVVEFFGVPRLLAGRESLSVHAETLKDALLMVEQTCPRLKGAVQPDGRLGPQFLVSLDGQGFVAELDHLLTSGTRIVLVSADVGG